jgi:hypothetical protein
MHPESFENGKRSGPGREPVHDRVPPGASPRATPAPRGFAIAGNRRRLPVRAAAAIVRDSGDRRRLQQLIVTANPTEEEVSQLSACGWEVRAVLFTLRKPRRSSGDEGSIVATGAGDRQAENASSKGGRKELVHLLASGHLVYTRGVDPLRRFQSIPEHLTVSGVSRSGPIRDIPGQLLAGLLGRLKCSGRDKWNLRLRCRTVLSSTERFWRWIDRLGFVRARRAEPSHRLLRCRRAKWRCRPVGLFFASGWLTITNVHSASRTGTFRH